MIELKIKELCKQKGITQQDLAEKLGIARATLSQKVNNNPTLQSLEDIANALEVPIQALFETQPGSATIICPHCGKPIEIMTK